MSSHTNVGEQQKQTCTLAAEGAKSGEVESRIKVAPEIEVGEHKKVASTRCAIQKGRSTDRAMFGGKGKFRLLVAPASGERACSVLDKQIGRASCRERVCQYV